MSDVRQEGKRIVVVINLGREEWSLSRREALDLHQALGSVLNHWSKSICEAIDDGRLADAWRMLDEAELEHGGAGADGNPPEPEFVRLTTMLRFLGD
jgi:hypothetical protein